MDALLSRLGYQALNMAMRSGLALTSTYAVSQCSRLMKKIDDKTIRTDLKRLQRQLNSKIKVVSPAIDLIEFKSGRGNAFLESAVPIARALHVAITSLNKELDEVALTIEQSPCASPPEQVVIQLGRIIADMKDLLARIDHDIPLLHMAITASGESLTSTLSPGVSPSRLLQASTLLNFGDTQYAYNPTRPVQIGPCFTFSLYMLFLGHADQSTKPPTTVPYTPDLSRNGSQKREPYGIEEGDRKPLWQEVLHKARSSEHSSVNNDCRPKPTTATNDDPLVDNRMLEQLQSLSLNAPHLTACEPTAQTSAPRARSFAARSPFGAIATSISLMEMLIRLASLQEFQQASHLSIDDHVLAFFLEETSTTGLDREHRWKARNKARRHIGFDPYTDTPTKL
ncbi:hypothetical protein D7B24_007578 [Verticillium nonalfalfae]|uniref:Ran-specific GTPase-activating protein 30 n=1 Tax=Verticillium nonalfalfae TaxID=1051616 RepID=A0A3M9Y7N5_9PEZI|nr:uncharacterized protein D7B24_007578 [Verticillium nonalfalfae]RNJ56195.1 hypothetical protein D7B24_007578 [Verticillium nonalfalfae]